MPDGENTKYKDTWKAGAELKSTCYVLDALQQWSDFSNTATLRY